MRGYQPPSTDGERLFVRRAEDLAAQVRAGSRSRTSLFCNEREQQLAEGAMRRVGWTEYCFAGGYPQAERKLLCVYDGVFDESVLPVCAFRVTVQGAGGVDAKPGHRDYLGALMALGIKRECIGDIVCNGPEAVVFVLRSVARVVGETLCEVGRCSVSVQPEEDSASLAAAQPQGETRTVTVSSLRLDALLAAMVNLSRSEAASLIERGAVQVNHAPAASAHYPVYENDVLTVRGKGKFKVSAVGGKSRKDRIFVAYFQYE